MTIENLFLEPVQVLISQPYLSSAPIGANSVQIYGLVNLFLD